MSYRIGPDLIEMYDEPQGPFCAICGCELEWEDCNLCGGDGELDWETLQFEDPLWYQPGDTEQCDQCEGMGGWWFCPNAGKHPE